MYSSEHIQVAVVVIDGVAVPNVRNFALVGERVEFVVGETEWPAIVEPRWLVLASEKVDIGVVCGDAAAKARTWHI